MYVSRIEFIHIFINGNIPKQSIFLGTTVCNFKADLQ